MLEDTSISNLKLTFFKQALKTWAPLAIIHSFLIIRPLYAGFSVVPAYTRPAAPTITTTAPITNQPTRSDDNSGISELEKERLKQKEAYDTINRLKEKFAPSTDSDPIPSASNSSSIVETPQNENVTALREVFSGPTGQKLTQAISNPDYLKNFRDLINTPLRSTVIAYEITWFIVIFIFRAWRKAKLDPGSWLKAAVQNFLINILFICGSSFLIPFYILGESYKKVVWPFVQIILDKL